MEPLRQFLESSLPKKPIDLGEGEVITDAVVVFAVHRIGPTGDIEERFRYTTTEMSLATALGLLDIGINTLTEYHISTLQEDEDGTDN